MTAMIMSLPGHGFHELTEDTEERSTRNHSCNDFVRVDRVSSSYGLVDDTDEEDVEENPLPQRIEDAKVSPSTAPSMDDVDSGNTFGGLQNLGNTCYLNSALQMIASLESFPRYIKEQKPGKEESELRRLLIEILDRLSQGDSVKPLEFKQELDARSSLFVGYRQQDSHEFLTTLLGLLDDDYKVGEDEDMEDVSEKSGHCTPEQSERLRQAQHEVEPSESANKKQRVEDSKIQENSPSIPASGSFKDLKFADIENLLYGTNSTASASLISTTAQDVSERQTPIYKLIGGRMDTAAMELTRLEDHSWKQGNCSSVKTSDVDESDLTVSQERNPVDSSFTTEVRVCLTCDSCKFRRSHKETYLHLSLEIGPHCSSIEDGIRKFFVPEGREVKCEKCFCETATQTTEITRLPNALLLHLKRFIVDVSPDYTSISYRKDQSPVTFEDMLGFEEDGVFSEFLAGDASLPEGNTYAIRSVVNHIGSSASCGHYTADAKRFYAKGNYEWTRFNDSFVSKIAENNAIKDSSQTAYMILYETRMSAH